MPTESVDGSPAATVVPLDDVRTPEQFVAAMRRRKAVSGLTYLELERRAHAVGDELSPEALLVGADGMPSERLVAAFVRACGDAPLEVAAWVAAHRSITAEAPEPSGAVPAGSVARARLSDLLPPVFVHARRPVRVLAVAVAGVLLATVAAVWVTSGPYEEYGAVPNAAPDDGGDADDEPEAGGPTPSPEGAVRKGPKPSPSRPPGATPKPTPSETAPEDSYPYPPPDDGPGQSPSEEPPPPDWPDGGGDGGTYCEPYPSPVCRHG